MLKLQSIYVKALSDKPAIIILTGDFNARSSLLWANETTNTSIGKKFADFYTLNCLQQLIDEPTHIPRDGIETCIDLICTNQPFLFVDSGVIPSPDPLLKHQVVFGKLNFNVPCPPPYKRKVWDFNLAHSQAIKFKIVNTPWEYLFSNKSLDDMVNIFSSTFLNIINSNVPSKVITCDDKDAPWVNSTIKNLMHKNRKLYSEWNSNGRQPARRDRVKQHQSKTEKAIIDAKNRYFENLSKKICDPTTGQKTFWSAYKRLSNKKKTSNIPPLFDNNIYIANFKEKASIFNKYFATQCQPFNIESTLPTFTPLTSNSISDVDFSVNKIVSIIKKLDTKRPMDLTVFQQQC